MDKCLNVMQIIDSLEVGGAERVSVNYANALAEYPDVNSHICVTRSLGPLAKNIGEEVALISLKRRRSVDFFALAKLIRYIRQHKIEILHAHTSSFFIAALIRPFVNVKVVWHLHNGEMKNIDKNYLKIMRWMSGSFERVVVVNSDLKKWAQEVFPTLRHKISYLANYPELKADKGSFDLPGKEGKRIVSLANLRYQKDHPNLLEAFKNLVNTGYDDWVVLLIGKDYDDSYSRNLKQFIVDNQLSENVYFLGLRTDVADILKSSAIGVISSQVEGLPMALLEYGLASLAVVSTDVGECGKVLQDGKVGLVVPKQDSIALQRALRRLMSDEALLGEYADLYRSYIHSDYSKDAAIEKLLGIYRDL